MEAKDSFTLSWCEKHKCWWVSDCPECMVDSNEQELIQKGRQDVVDMVEKGTLRMNTNMYGISLSKEAWEHIKQTLGVK